MFAVPAAPWLKDKNAPAPPPRRSPSKTVLVDNWLLARASRLLSTGVRKQPKAGEYIGQIDDCDDTFGLLTADVTRKNALGSWQAAVLTDFLALYQLLDVVVLGDSLSYLQGEWCRKWSRRRSLEPIRKFLRPVRFPKSLLEDLDLTEAWLPAPPDGVRPLDHTAENGARFYHVLSRSVGMQYWPSPQRARSLASGYRATCARSVAVQGDDLEHELEACLAPLVKEQGELGLDGLPGFAALILSQCDAKSSILPTALQYRRSEACRAYRKWMRDLGGALAKGDLSSFATALGDLEDVLRPLRALVLARAGSMQGLELRLGLAPALEAPQVLSRQFVFPARGTERIHLTFLRENLEQQLFRSEAWQDAQRVFGPIDKGVIHAACGFV